MLFSSISYTPIIYKYFMYLHTMILFLSYYIYCFVFTFILENRCPYYRFHKPHSWYIDCYICMTYIHAIYYILIFFVQLAYMLILTESLFDIGGVATQVLFIKKCYYYFIAGFLRLVLYFKLLTIYNYYLHTCFALLCALVLYYVCLICIIPMFHISLPFIYYTFH